MIGPHSLSSLLVFHNEGYLCVNTELGDLVILYNRLLFLNVDILYIAHCF